GQHDLGLRRGGDAGTAGAGGVGDGQAGNVVGGDAEFAVIADRGIDQAAALFVDLVGQFFQRFGIADFDGGGGAVQFRDRDRERVGAAQDAVAYRGGAGLCVGRRGHAVDVLVDVVDQVFGVVGSAIE